MNWFKKTPQTDEELQAELKALCLKVIAKQYTSVGDMDRYEELLREIFLRKLEPCMTLKPEKTI